MPALFVVFLSFQSDRSSDAAEAIDAASGEGQTFTPGYAGRAFAETFHREETYGVTTRNYSDYWLWQKKAQFSATYDANVFNQRHDPKDDMIYTYGVPISVSKKGSAGYLDIFYSITRVQYVENHKLNRINHGMGTSSSYRAGKFTFNFTDTFVPSSAQVVGDRTELSTTDSATGTASTRVITMTNTAALNTEYEHSPKTTVSVLAQHDVFYLPSATNSRAVQNFSTQTYTIAPKLSYQWTPKTNVHLDYRWKLIDYFVGTGDFDSVESLTSVGIKGRLTPKIGYTFDAGIKNRDYRHVAVDAHLGYVMKAAVSRKITEKIVGSLAWQRDTLIEALDSTQARSLHEMTDDYGVNLTWRVTPHLDLDLDASAGFIDRGGKELVTERDPDNPTLTFTRQSIDEFYQWDAILNWHPRNYLTLLLGYYYFNKNSSFKNTEYDNQKLVGSVEYKF